MARINPRNIPFASDRRPGERHGQHGSTIPGHLSLQQQRRSIEPCSALGGRWSIWPGGRDSHRAVCHIHAWPGTKRLWRQRNRKRPQASADHLQRHTRNHHPAPQPRATVDRQRLDMDRLSLQPIKPCDRRVFDRCTVQHDLHATGGHCNRGDGGRRRRGRPLPITQARGVPLKPDFGTRHSHAMQRYLTRQQRPQRYA